MPWVTRYRNKITYTGFVYKEPYRVWVQPSTSTRRATGVANRRKKARQRKLKRQKAIEYSRQQNLRAQRIREKRRAAARQKARDLARIKRRAKAYSAKQAKIAARKRMYKQLQDRAKAIRGTIAPSTQGKTGVTLGGFNPGQRGLPLKGRVRGGDWSKAAKPPPPPPERPRKAGQVYQDRQRRNLADLEKARAKKGTPAAAKLLERLVKEARDTQKRTGGRQLNTTFVSNVMSEYSAYVEEIAKKVERSNKKMQTFFTKRGGQWYFKSKADQARYLAFAKDPKYRRLMREYDRLYGKKGGETGSLTLAYGASQAIGDDQRIYMRDAAKSVFLGGRQSGEDYRARVGQWEKSEKWLYEASIKDIDPLKTSVIYDPTTGKSRRRTVQEEFDYRQGQYEAEMLRQIEELRNRAKLKFGMEQARKRRIMNRPGAAGRGSAFFGIAGGRQKEMYEAMMRLGYDEDSLHRHRDRLKRTVDDAMVAWEKKNKHWFQNVKAGSKERTLADGMSRPDWTRWQRARDAHEKELWRAFGTEKPSGLESLFDIPIVKPTLQGLDTLVGLVGTLPRIGSKMVSNSSSKVFGVEPSYDQAPAAMRKKFEEQKTASGLQSYGMRGVAAPGGGKVAAFHQWLKTPEGKRWYKQQYEENLRISQEEDDAFLSGVYSDKTDIWEKMEAISNYGGQPFRNPVANLAFGILGDPTAALPLKFTTWLARWKHATETTRDVSKLRRWWDVGTQFQKVSEPHLRWRASIKEATKDLLDGKDAKVFADEVLSKLAGMKGPTRDKAAAEFLESIGVNPRTASGKRILTAAEEAIIADLKKAGVDYRDVARQAEEGEYVREAAAAAKKAEAAKRAAAPTAAEARAAGRAAERRQAAEAGRVQARMELQLEREAAEAAILKREARATVSRIPADQPLYRRVDDPITQPERQVLEMQAGDPLRRAVAEGREFQSRLPDVHESSYRPDPAQEQADVIHAITGAQDVVTYHGVQFAPGAYTDAFRQSETYGQIRLYLDDVIPEGRGPEAAALREATEANKSWARRTLYQHGRESIARQTRELEGLGRPPGEGLVRGKIPWARSRKEGTAYAVEGGRKSHQQHITTRTELAERSGAVSPAEEMAVAGERRAFEDLKKRIVTGAQKLKKGTWSEERWQEELNEIRLVGVVRRRADLTVDLRSGEGTLFRGRDLDHIREGGISGFIPVGDVLVEDYLRYGDFTHYYETVSLLPELMKGAGYETSLMMDTILVPQARAAFGRADFARVLRTNMFQTVQPSPREFRQGLAHLHALFHLTLLDAEKAIPEINRLYAQYVVGKLGPRQFRKAVLAADPTGSMELLRSYSKSVEVMLESDYANVFGRAWKVMESRAGVYWADDFAVSEGAFVATSTIPGSLLHPNLALGMIPYGAVARTLPITHGFTGHLRNIAATMSDLFKASNPSWTDESVIDQFGFIANDRRLSAREQVTKATQIVHYIASRYGNSLRRSRFSTVLDDFSLDAVYTASKKAPEADHAYQLMRSRYIELMAPTRRIDLDISGKQPLFGADPRTYDQLAAEFDNQFTRAIRGGLKRREYNEATRAIYERSYWLSEVSHSNPGLHTSAFLAKMGDPKLQRGNSWLGYANVYWLHMSGAGAEAEAREVLREVFEPELRRAVGEAYEGITGAAKSSGPLPNQWLGGINEFFIRSGLMPDMERIVAEGRARAEKAKGYAEQEAELVAYRDDLLINDDALRTQRETAQAGETAMYDMANIGNLVDEAARQGDLVTASSEAIGKLIDEGRVRPPDKTMDALHKAYKKALYGEGGSAAALRFLKKLPADQRAWMMAEVRGIKAAAELTRVLNSVVRRTIDMGAIPSEVAEDMADLVKVVREMDGGEMFLAEWAEKYYADLFQSRLIDYVKNEPWFEYMERARGIKEATPREAVFARIQEIKKLLDGDLSREERVLLYNERRQLGRELDEMVKPTPLEPVTEVPRPPSPDELNHGRISMSRRGLEILGGMSEEQWLDRELLLAQRVRNRSRGPRRQAAAKRIRNIERAKLVIGEAKKGSPGEKVSDSQRAGFAARVVAAGSERARALMAPGHITKYVVNGGGLEVEQGRALNRLLRTAPVRQDLGVKVRRPGEVSANYAKHGPAIEAAFGQAIVSPILHRFGYPDDLLSELTATQFITELDEFRRALRDPKFNEFVQAFTKRMDERLKEITNDPSYTIEQWLDDRLTVRDDHFDARLFDKHEQSVADAISAARGGARRQTRTDLRRLPGNRPENPLTELVETDIRAVIGKAKKLSELGIDPHAYNEARKVLRGPMLKKRYGQQIYTAAVRETADVLYAAGHRVEDADWDKVYQAEYDKQFLSRRQTWADREADSLLEQLANENHGATVEEVIQKFEKQYGMDNDLKGYEPAPISHYQRRTIEEATKTFLGVKNLDDIGEMRVALSAHGQHPPFHDRKAMTEWLTKYGFWSPRTGEEIAASGKASWDIETEAKYYMDNWGYVPDWSNPKLLEEGGDLNHILHDEVLRGEQYRQWGLFNDNMKARFESGKMGRVERARFLVEGSAALGVKAKRDLALERKFVIERFGRLVTDDVGNLTAFPELMNRAEMRQYVISRTASGADIPPGIMQSPEELDIFYALIDKHVGDMVDGKYLAGQVVTYEDVFEMAAKISHDLMMDPIWLKRNRDKIGSALRGQAALRRSLVFTQPAFAITNAVDSVIKGSWAGFTTRSFHTQRISARAQAMTLLDFGFDPTGQLLHDVPLHGTERIRAAGKQPPRQYWVPARGGRPGRLIQETPGHKVVGDALARIQGVTELPAQGAAASENFFKLRLAQKMYDDVYARTLKEVGDEDLADALSRKFIKDEVGRLWPTAGDGPYEQLFNQISPFISYQAKNHVVFIGEMFGHPQLFNYFNRIGDYIESENRKRWAEEHPHEVPNDIEMRLIELPWAPGVFVDLGAWSDAQRGLKPLYDIVEGKATVGSLASQFVRLASANDLNIAYGILNALDFGTRMEWVQGRDENGFPTGSWSQVEVPWEAPWGGAANALNSFWPVQLAAGVVEANMDGKFSVQELTVLAYQTAFFGGIKQHDTGAGLNSYYFALKSKSPEAAEAFLETADGKALQTWWDDRTPKTEEFYTPEAIKKMFHPGEEQKKFADWDKSKEWHEQVNNGFKDLDDIDRKWNNLLWKLDPASKAYSEAKLRRNIERWEYYRTHPFMYEFFALSMTPADWARMVDEMTVDHLMDSFFKIVPEDFKTYDEYLKAREEFLAANPLVKERLGRSRTMVEGVWKQTEDHWFDVLDKVGRIDTAIEAARQAEDFDLVDQLYMIKELGYKELNKEVAVQYWDPTTDFQTLPKGMQGPTQQRRDPFGHKLLPRFRVLPDFSKWQWDRATPEKRAEITRNTRYGEGMAAVIKKAKASGDFGASFFQQLKANPWLMNEYFRRNPGKREQWGANDAYFNLISKFGILMKQGKFNEGNAYFDRLPDWVKARYYAKHPDRRARVKQNLEYMNWMRRWVAHYKKRDYEGGAQFFEKMPEWVKRRYYEKHPGGFGRGGGKTSGYAKAMGNWVDLLEAGKHDEADRYFKSLPQAYQDRYRKKHPETGYSRAMGKWVGLLEAKKYDEAEKYFASMPKAYRDRYRARHPETGYSKAMGKWVGLLEAGKKEEAKKFFASMPKAYKDRYYAKHPEQKLRDDIRRTGQLARYFAADDNNRALMLKENPEFAKWLRAQADNEQTRRMLIMAGYQAIPKGESWLKRVYREKYPEIFSKEAAGERSLKKTYSFLAEHPEMNAGFEKWLAAVWASYEENIKHAGTRPKPVEIIHPRQHGSDRRRPHRGKSAAWVRLHSLS